jgi:[ribosomal protein S18]-alanine N-acetyltransferase
VCAGAPGTRNCHYNIPVDFSLRDFQRDDFEALWRIDQQCFAPGISYSQPELAAYIGLLGSFTLVAESSNSERRILGFVVGRANRRRQGHIITIDVLPDARRFGVGSKLLSAAEDRLRSAQCATVNLETAVNNMTALAFYKRHQYFVIKTIPRYYPDGLDAFALEKSLLSTPSHK